MPIIDLSLSETDIIDARVVVSFDRLSLILRNVIDESNQHHNDIAELKSLLESEKARGDELERLLKEDTTQNSIVDMTKEIEDLKKVLDELKEEVEQNAQATSDKLKIFSVFEEGIAYNAEELKKQQESVEILQEQVKGLLIPPPKHGISLEKQVAELNEFRNKSEPRILGFDAFIECWSADTTKMLDLCEKNYEGRYIISEPTRTDYILSLAPFIECSNQYRARDELLRGALEEKIIGNGYRSRITSNTGINGDDTNAEIAHLVNEVKSQQQTVRNALGILDNTVKVQEDLPRRVAALEDAIRSPVAQKLDADEVIDCPTCGSPSRRGSLNLVPSGSITPHNRESVASVAPAGCTMCPTCNNGYIFTESACPQCGTVGNSRSNTRNNSRAGTSSLPAIHSAGANTNNVTETDQIVNCPTCGSPSRRGSLQPVPSGTITPHKRGSVPSVAAAGSNLCPTCKIGYIFTEKPCTQCGAVRNFLINNDNLSFSGNFSRPLSTVQDESRPKTASIPKLDPSPTNGSSGNRSLSRATGGDFMVRTSPSRHPGTTPVRVFMGRTVATVRDNNGCVVPASIGSMHY